MFLTIFGNCTYLFTNWLKVGCNTCLLTGKTADGAQSMPPPNMALWHTEYFKVKEFEKREAAERSLWPSLDPSLLKSSHKAFIGEVASLYREKRTILISKMERNPEESKWTGLAKFPPVYYTYLLFFDLSYLSMTSSFINPSIKIHRFNHFFGS